MPMADGSMLSVDNCRMETAVLLMMAFSSLIRVVTDVLESLVKIVIVTESETANEKEKVRIGLEEIRRKTIQVESMSVKVEEMEKCAVGRNGMLNEMRQRVEDMVLETTRQRQRAAEYGQELSCVKNDFESLRTYVSTLVSVSETLLSSEKQFETMEKIFDRKKPRSRRTNQLETEKAQKEAEVQKAMEEDVRLRAGRQEGRPAPGDERAVQVHGFEPSKLVEDRHTR